MPGTNAGTGQPLVLRCAKCKRDSRDLFKRYGDNLVATGRVRPLMLSQQGHGGPRVTNRRIEYLCRDCGHKGWSRHKDAERLIILRMQEKVRRLQLRQGARR